MSGVFVGVDSGGTRTNVKVMVRRDGHEKFQHYEVADSLSGALPKAQISDICYRIFSPLEMVLEDLVAQDLPIYVWVSAAGYSPGTREQFAAVLHEALPSMANGQVRAVGAANDAVTILLGLRADGMVIAGTGSSVLVNEGSHNLRQAGGHEWVASDSGSGFWIGMQAIRQAYRDFEAGHDSVLLQRFRQMNGISFGDEQGLIARLRDLAVSDSDMKKGIAQFAASVCDAAERGDQGAQDIVKAEAEELADTMAGAIRRYFEPSHVHDGVKLVQCGSVISNEFYRMTFESQVEMRLRTDTQHRANVEWQRVKTGEDASIELASELADTGTDYRTLGSPFRPVVVRFQ